MCFKNKYNSCPICMELKKPAIKCKICTNTEICTDCIVQLCEKGLCSKCPVCRQENWKQSYSTKIIPFKKYETIEKKNKKKYNSENISNQETMCNDIYNIILIVYIYLRFITFIISCMVIIWLLGFILTKTFTDLELQKNYAYIWFPYIMSLSYIIPIICCYFKTDD